MTNFERIKAMTFEEMAAWIIAVQYAPMKQEADKWSMEIPSLKECIEADIDTQIKWLESEVKADD